MSIKVGDPAPPVTVEAYVRAEAEPVSMDIGRPGGSWTVLFFYPRDFTFVCPTELRGFAELEADFALDGAAVVAASTDSWHVHRAWLETSPGLTGIHYPVIADPTQELTASTACSTTTSARPIARPSSSIPRGSCGTRA